MPGAKQPCPMVAACWSPAMPQDADRRRRTARAASRRNRRRSRAPRAAEPSGTPNSAARSRSQPPRRISNSSVRDALVASVAWTLPPVSRHSRKVSTVPKASRPVLGRRARAGRHGRAASAILVAEKYGSSTSPVFAATAASWPARAQRRAGVGGAPVLPDDGVVDRLAGGAIPDDRGLALVGDADAGDVLRAERRPCAIALAHGRDHGRPDLLRIVLDPAGRGIDLPQLLLRRGDRRERRVEHDRARRGGALVDGDEVAHGAMLTPFPRPERVP